ncbi:MAG TPA: c-type cytochrome biogenesis protein CcmI [Methylovirgula sp.]|nr:c-type cytochrome biogenesis protein CcmI [Methylovirgula sp.]
MLWGIFALLTGVAVFAILWPLAKPVRKAASPDIAFYRAKLDEIQRDAELANISPADAEVAKTEAARQLLAAAEKDQAATFAKPPAGSSRLRLVALVALILVPALALGLYAAIGHPDWPDEPLEARLNAPAEAMDINAAIAKVEAHLAQHPEDGLGYEVLVPAYLQLGRIADAVRAAQMALQKLGESPQRLTDYGETLVFANNGIVTQEARELFERAAAMGASPKALFYLGLAASQEGDKGHARGYWQKLLAQSPPNAPWRSDLEARLASLGNQSAIPDQAAAIAALPPAERAAAIHAMIDRLAARLAENGQDIEGWLRLVRAYKVINETDKARAALATARRNFGGDAAATARIDALAHELGLDS